MGLLQGWILPVLAAISTVPVVGMVSILLVLAAVVSTSSGLAGGWCTIRLLSRIVAHPGIPAEPILSLFSSFTAAFQRTYCILSKLRFESSPLMTWTKLWRLDIHVQDP